MPWPGLLLSAPNARHYGHEAHAASRPSNSSGSRLRVPQGEDMMNMLSIVAFLLAAVTAQQGQAVRLSLPDEPGIQSVKLFWQDKAIPYTRAGKAWVTVVGVDLEMKAGNYPGEIHVTRDGNVEKLSVTLNVKAVKFPVQRLQV